MQPYLVRTDYDHEHDRSSELGCLLAKTFGVRQPAPFLFLRVGRFPLPSGPALIPHIAIIILSEFS
jgi:hypothetical protein